jgi:hypothetical protein
MLTIRRSVSAQTDFVTKRLKVVMGRLLPTMGSGLGVLGLIPGTLEGFFGLRSVDFGLWTLDFDFRSQISDLRKPETRNSKIPIPKAGGLRRPADLCGNYD